MKREPEIELVVRGPTQVTKLPGFYFPQDPNNALIATLAGGERFIPIEKAKETFKSGYTYYRIRLSDGREGYVQPGRTDSSMWYARHVGGVEWKYSRVTDVEVLVREDKAE